VQYQISDVVSSRIHPPQPSLDPEHGISHRPVVRRFGAAP
jgi:hypothetical protein